ncbi:MAG: c-type cytochrome [Rhodospirillaceae bacterium]|nr:c-type cytochrome [Rhodospirillaceae bacterium]
MLPSIREETGVDTEAGRQFAEGKCARCHAVGRTGPSPYGAAPPFRTFAQRWPLESIEEALAEGIDIPTESAEGERGQAGLS